MKNKIDNKGNVLWTDKKRILGMPISFTRYILSVGDECEKIYIKTGFLSTYIDEINLYRVYDIKISQSLFQKIFGVGTISLYSNDATNPALDLISIKNPYKVRNLLSEQIEKARERKNVRIGEFY